MNPLREYQNEIYSAAKSALAIYRSILIQLHTGGGKTVIFTAMADAVFGKGKRVWIIVPRKQLILQASKHLKKWNVPHGIIDSKNNESRAYLVHVISKETLIRRWDKIKNMPQLVIIDEAHINLDFQIKLAEFLPKETKIIGYTATPQRLDSRGLSIKSGGIYETMIEGPSIPWLSQNGYLANLRYFSPPLEGLEKIKTDKFGEYDSESLEELLQRRKVYGDLISHWEKWGKNKSTLIFCRSVKSAHHAAERFREHGYNFVAIDGSMTDLKVNEIIEKHRKGEIQGICNCLLVTYGVDIERIEYIGDISPTESRTMYMQKIGRGLRPFRDEKTGHIKTDLIYMDHVNQILAHQDDKYPGIPLHYVPEISWNFDGTEKRKKSKSDKNIKLCPHLDFMYCEKPTCANCRHNPDKGTTDARKSMIIIPADLEEIKKPVSLADMERSERAETENKISDAILEFKQDESKLSTAVNKLLTIADSCGYSVFWVYHQLTSETRHTVNVPVLAEISRQKNYASGWLYFARQKIKAKGA